MAQSIVCSDGRTLLEHSTCLVKRYILDQGLRDSKQIVPYVKDLDFNNGICRFVQDQFRKYDAKIAKYWTLKKASDADEDDLYEAEQMFLNEVLCITSGTFLEDNKVYRKLIRRIR